MTSASTQERTDAIEVYWMPGCSSCLRMKEFIEKTGLDYEEVNVAANPAGAERLRKFGLTPPAVAVGETAIPGLDLVEIAKLIGVTYDRPPILSPTEFHDKYEVIIDTVIRLIDQFPTEALTYKSPDRDRDMAELAGHAGSIMRVFVSVYETDVYDKTIGNPPEWLRSKEQLLECATETKAMFDAWWTRSGYDDPLDHVVETFWGYRTLLETLERAVWHTAQHTRQIAYFLETSLNIAPDRPLTGEVLAGLPIPDRIHA